MRIVVSRAASLTLFLALALALALGCPSEKASTASEKASDKAPEVPAEPAAPSEPAADPTPAQPDIPEPAGIEAGARKPPEPPTGKGSWEVDPAATAVSFTIVSNSAGPVTGHFPGGAAGALDAKGKGGVFTVDLTTMVTTTKDGSKNPLRDTNVIESFFGARPFAQAALKKKVEDAWRALAGKIANGVKTAALVVDSIEGEAAKVKDGAAGDGVVNGRLILWESVEVPVSFPVTASRKGKVLEVKGQAPSVFDIEAVTGSAIRKKLFETMLAAGCAHQPGLQNTVSVALETVTLKQR
jgi:hypothetical protein